LVHKFEQCLRRRILGGEALDVNASLIQHGFESLRLGGRVGMVGDLKNEERRMPLSLLTCVTAG
jgi:hypothetical protein